MEAVEVLESAAPALPARLDLALALRVRPMLNLREGTARMKQPQMMEAVITVRGPTNQRLAVVRFHQRRMVEARRARAHGRARMLAIHQQPVMVLGVLTHRMTRAVAPLVHGRVQTLSPAAVQDWRAEVLAQVALAVDLVVMDERARAVLAPTPHQAPRVVLRRAITAPKAPVRVVRLQAAPLDPVAPRLREVPLNPAASLNSVAPFDLAAPRLR